MPHSFSPGDIVLLRGGVYSMKSPNNQYEIRQCLPSSDLVGGHPTYRVVNMADGHERVVSEGLIARRDPPSGERPPAVPLPIVTQLKRPAPPRGRRALVPNIAIDLNKPESNGELSMTDEPKPHEKTQQDRKVTTPDHGMPGPRGHLDQQDQRGTGGKPRNKDKKGDGSPPQHERKR